jgi:hypothetical protein
MDVNIDIAVNTSFLKIVFYFHEYLVVLSEENQKA